MAILKMLYNDFIGSDTQKSYSLTYVWMANQFGHIFIGFGLSFLIVWFFSWLLSTSAFEYSTEATSLLGLGLPRGLLIVLIVMFLYSLKEGVWDFLIDAKPQLDEELRGFLKSTIHFRRDIAWDCLTDWTFVASGALLAAGAFGVLGWLPISIFGLALLCWIGLAVLWLPSRQNLELIGSPFFTRLFSTQFKIPEDAKMTKEEVAGVFREAIADDVPRKRFHIVIGGPPNHGKSTLAAALVIERVLFRNEPCARYTTYAKLMETIDKAQIMGKTQNPAGRDKVQGREVLSSESAELLLIDDVPFTRELGPFNQSIAEYSKGRSFAAPPPRGENLVLKSTAPQPSGEAPAAPPASAPAANPAAPAATPKDLERVIDFITGTQLVIWVVSNVEVSRKLQSLLELADQNSRIQPITIEG